jgi:hypothetical protein
MQKDINIISFNENWIKRELDKATKQLIDERTLIASGIYERIDEAQILEKRITILENELSTLIELNLF